jgi:hypothetical protein
VRQLREGPAQLVAALRNRLPDDALVSARIMEHRANDELVLTPLIEPSAPLMIIRDQQRRAIEIVTDSGYLWQNVPPAFKLATERGPVHRKPKSLLAASIRDVPILRRLGFSVVPMGGLADMGARQARELFSRTSSTLGPVYRVVLVGWELDALVNEMSTLANRTLQRLYDLLLTLELQLEHVHVDAWRPQPHDFELILAASRVADRRAMKRTLVESMERSSRPAIEVQQKMLDDAELDLPTAFVEARATIARATRVQRPAEGRRAAQKLREAIARTTTDRLIQAAQTTTDPTTAVLLLATADGFEGLLQNNALLSKLDRVAQSEHPDSAPTNGSTAEDHRRAIDQLIKLAKALR